MARGQSERRKRCSLGNAEEENSGSKFAAFSEFTNPFSPATSLISQAPEDDWFYLSSLKAAGQPRSSCGKVANARRTSVHELRLRPCNGRRRTHSGAMRSELSNYSILLMRKSHSCNYRIVRTRGGTRLDERTGLFSDLQGALSALRSHQPKLEFRAAQLDGELGGPKFRACDSRNQIKNVGPSAIKYPVVSVSCG